MARKLLFVLGVIGSLWPTSCNESVNYTDYDLYRLRPADAEQVGAALALQQPGLEVLKPSRGPGDTHDVLVHRSGSAALRHFAANRSIDIELKTTNYGRSFEKPARSGRRRNIGFRLFGYNSYNVMLEYLAQLRQSRPEVMRLEQIGNSYQGRPMTLVKISANPDAGNPVILVDAGIHAREWVAPAMAMYLVDRLSDPANAAQLKGLDWYIVPLVNPDGYQYTRMDDDNRLWRKTRSRSPTGCYGVDGNRNYGFKWGVSGVSTDPCDRETFAGSRPFTEPETSAIRNVMTKYADKLKLYVSLHAYGNYLVYPWGYTGDILPKGWKRLHSMAQAVSDSIVRAGGQPMKVMSAGKWYPAAGGSDDFAYGAIGVPYSYTMELTDGYEFQMPERLLKSHLTKFYEGFRTFGELIVAEFPPSGAPKVC